MVNYVNFLYIDKKSMYHSTCKLHNLLFDSLLYFVFMFWLVGWLSETVF